MSEARRVPVVGVDAMGGDVGPAVVVPGALAALDGEGGFRLRLYGDEVAIRSELGGRADDSTIEVVPCSQAIAMNESPATAIRSRPDSPIVRAMRDQAEGGVDAVVSAGSTGAMVAASLLILGRLPSVDRPAIATVVPTVGGEILLVDAGANVQCTPEHLLTFARMGALYAREMLRVPDPTVGLLNIGEEATKGNELTVAAHELLRSSGLHFVGNVESNRLLQDAADVVVTDGYTGNIVLKLVEGIGQFLAGLGSRSDMEPAARSALRPLLAFLQEHFSYERYGGALLLGIEGVSIISHGRSTSRAIANAVRVAHRQVQLAIPRKLQATLAA
ncbi:MAG: phosphate acyltransferase PlsX [Candidatus Krumholzibacteriia bacterium]